MNNMKYGSIATGSKEASETALNILKLGGNAFDAAIGAVFTSMTSEFSLTGPFGGGICIGNEKNETPFAYDFFVDCPNSMKTKKEFKEISVNFGKATQKFHIGKGSIAVPGNILGLIEIHNNHGTLSLEQILLPAIDYAVNGIKISSYQAYIMSLIKPILTFEKNKLFYKKKSLIKGGDTFKNPNFGDFLKIILNKGPEYFYNGDGLNHIMDFLGDSSCLSANDFQEYKVNKRNPISIKFKEHEIYTNPAPAYGGTLIIFILELLKDKEKIYPIDIIKGMNLATRARNEVCRNPENENEIQSILDINFIERYKRLFSNEIFEFSSENQGFGSTTHVSVLDRDGNAASITTTNGEGCGRIIPKYGIMMNNMLGEVDLNPYGFHNWNTKRRLPTMMSPMIAIKDNKTKFVLGSGGSNRIRSANTQVILNLLCHKMNLKDAIDLPRFHLENTTLYSEPNILIPDNRLRKKLTINQFDEKNLFFGGVNAVSDSEAIGDSRRGGSGIIN